METKEQTKKRLKKEKFFEKYIEPVLIQYGIDPATVTSHPENTKKLEDICYACKCGKCLSKRYKAMNINPLCDICAKKPTNKRGPKGQGIEKFEEIALANGYKLTPKEGEVYENTKSRITVTNIETGETHTSSYASFRTGHIHSHHHASLQKTLSITEVKKRVKEAGFIWIEGTIYIDAKTPIKVLCHCGDECMIAVANLHEDRVGCEKCYRYKRHHPWHDIEGIADKYGCKLITQEKDYKGRDTMLWFICPCGEACNKTAKNFLKASWCDNCADQFRKDTNMERYGAENYLASEEGKKKTEDYWMTNHGVKHNMQVIENQEKAQNTCMKTHGVPWVIGTKENEEKRFAALMAKYGTKTTLHTESFKKTMRERYDCEHNMQHSETYTRMCKNRFKLKKYTFPSGRVEYVRGYEPLCLDYLLFVEGIDEDDIIVHPSEVPEVFYEYNGETHRYYMDIYIQSEDRGIEVKSDYTYRKDQQINSAKWMAASELHTEFVVYVFDLRYKCVMILSV